MALSLTIKVPQNVNYTVSMLKKKVVTGILTDSDRETEAVIHITAEPAVFFETSFGCSIKKGSQEIAADHQVINVELFREGIREARECQITAVAEDAFDPGKILARTQTIVHVQPYNHWDEHQSRESLISFLTPNNELVTEVVAEAAELLKKDGLELTGYSGHTPEQVLKIAGAVYDAISARKLHYNLSPRSFESAGQKIRLPAAVLSDSMGTGTCIDLAVLYASCLEAVKLHPALLITDRHCLAGVWSEERTFSETCMTDMDEVLRQAGIVRSEGGCHKPKNDSGDTEKVCGFYPVENTMMTGDNSRSFETALQYGMRPVPEVQYVLDVFQGRGHGYVPCFTYTNSPRDRKEDHMIEKSTPDIMERAPRELKRIDKLKNEAMDLSRRNPLITGAVSGISVRLSGYKPSDLIECAIRSDAFLDMVYNSLDSQGLKGSEKLKCMENLLKDVRASEKGIKKGKTAGSLYLTFGELEFSYGGRCQAPLYLCPVDIYYNRMGMVVVSLIQEGVTFNPVLTALMQQAYNINMSKIAESAQKADSLQAYLEKSFESDLEKIRSLISLHDDWKICEDSMLLSFLSVPNDATMKVLDSPELTKHPIAGAILADYLNLDNDTEATQPQEQEAAGIYVLQADQSQVEILGELDRRKAYVISGPAGNGKTQTIVNTICNQMHKGHNTLVITKSDIAMSVIYKQLETLKIDPFVLRLQGQGKALRKSFHSQISKALTKLKAGRNMVSEPVEISTEKYLSCTKELTEINENLRREYEGSGKTYISLLEEYSGYDVPELSSVSRLSEEKWDDNRVMATLEYLSQDLEWKSGSSDESFIRFDQIENDKIQAGKAAEKAIAAYQEAMKYTDRIDQQLGLHLPSEDAARMGITFNYIKFLFQREKKLDNIQQIRAEILGKIEKIRAGRKRKLRNFLLGNELKNSLWDQLSDYLTEEKCWDLRNSMPLEDVSDYINSEDFINDLSSGQQEGVSESSEEEHNLLNALDKEFAKLPAETRAGFKKGLDFFSRPGNQAFRDAYEQAAVKIKYFSNCQEEAEKRIVTDPDAFKNKYPGQTEIKLFKKWLNGPKDTSDKFFADNEEMRQAGIDLIGEEIDNLILEKKLVPEKVVDAYKKSVCRLKIGKIQTQYPELKSFSGPAYAIALKVFRNEEKSIREGLRRNLVREHMKRNRDLREGITSGDMSILNRFSETGESRYSVRQLFAETNEALQKLFTCMLMTPETAADLLADSPIQFDMVLFDEGSQTATFEALPAIIKSKRIRVFGDKEQMLPDSAFKKLGVEDGEKNTIESILKASHFMPSTMLTNHYRSDSEELIAFSNKKFYGGNLNTFPSCHIGSRNLVSIQVENGLYNSGTDGKNWNIPEAEEVISTIYRIAEDLPAESNDTIGVITMNAAQRNLIQNLFRQRAMEEALNREVEILNLSDCQGSEWDHVIISTVYGPAEDGSISVNMGYLSQDGGRNRLNVMITRAKKKLYLVTSLRPEAFHGRELKEGVQTLIEFIEYAGKLEKSDSGVICRTCEDLEELRQSTHLRGITLAVSRELIKNGYAVRTDIGSSSRKVDIGVISKDNNECYQLGILLDHPEEKTAGAVREREIIFPYTLTRRGWNIYRLHSIFWYQDPQKVMKALLNQLNHPEKNVYREEGL